MNTTNLIREYENLAELLRLCRQAQNLAQKPRSRPDLLSSLACLETGLSGLRRRMLEAALTELLWQYLDHIEGTDTGYVARQLLADIGARR